MSKEICKKHKKVDADYCRKMLKQDLSALITAIDDGYEDEVLIAIKNKIDRIFSDFALCDRDKDIIDLIGYFDIFADNMDDCGVLDGCDEEDEEYEDEEDENEKYGNTGPYKVTLNFLDKMKHKHKSMLDRFS